MSKLLALLLLSALALLAEVAPGNYIGEWSGAASGEFRILLSQDAGQWKANVVFTLGNDEVTTKLITVKVDGDKLNVVYQYDLQGNTLQSNVTGELKGNTLSGTYKATSVPDGTAVDEGTWKATAK